MSAVSIIAKLLGPLEVRLEKLASAGTITYAPREEGQNYDYTADKRELLWKEFDDNPATTGEESALGMPSAGGINKAGGLEDGQYGQPDGPYSQGGFDADQSKADKDHRLSSAMQESFKALDNYDQSYAAESPMTQPHGGPKYANMTAMGLGAGMNPASLTKQMNPLTSGPKMPKMPKVTDPRAPGIPANHNLQHAVQGNSYGGLGSQSMASPETRFMGNPL